LVKGWFRRVWTYRWIVAFVATPDYGVAAYVHATAHWRLPCVWLIPRFTRVAPALWFDVWTFPYLLLLTSRLTVLLFSLTGCFPPHTFVTRTLPHLSPHGYARYRFRLFYTTCNVRWCLRSDVIWDVVPRLHRRTNSRYRSPPFHAHRHLKFQLALAPSRCSTRTRSTCLRLTTRSAATAVAGVLLRCVSIATICCLDFRPVRYLASRLYCSIR